MQLIDKMTFPKDNFYMELNEVAKKEPKIMWLLTVFMLLVFYPVGVLFMFKFLSWPTWVKVLVTALVPIWVGLVAAFSLIIVNPAS